VTPSSSSCYKLRPSSSGYNDAVVVVVLQAASVVVRLQ